MTKEICPLCERELGTINVDQHHLIPKTFKGKETIKLHKICHQKIHATFTERELFNYYFTIEKVKEHNQIQKFINWVKKFPIDYFDINKETTIRKNKRK